MRHEVLEYSQEEHFAAAAHYSMWSVSPGEALAASGVEHIIGELEAAGPGGGWQRPFYLLLANNILPRLSGFSTAVHCLFLANAMHAIARPGAALFIADYSFLPAALPLASLGHKVLLPRLAKRDMDTVERLIEAFAPFLPPGALCLGHAPDATAMLASLDTFSLQPGAYKDVGANAILSGPKDSLGNARHEAGRRAILNKGFLKATIELPGSMRRLGSGPIGRPFFAMWLNGRDNRTAHMALASEERTGRLNQRQALESFLAVDEGDCARNINVEKLASSRLCNLTFDAASLIAREPELDESPVLGSFAEILRCQLRRRGLQTSVEPEESGIESGAVAPGRQADGSFIAREVGLGDLDPLTGLLSGGKGRLALLMASEEQASSFFLRENDILFAFRGTESGLGASGFVPGVDAPSLPASHLYIIRARRGVSPVWLYYTIKSAAFRKLARSFASGSSQMFINVDVLRKLPLARPDAAEVARIEEIHARLVEDWRGMEKIYARMGQYMRQLGLVEPAGAGAENKMQPGRKSEA